MNETTSLPTGAVPRDSTWSVYRIDDNGNVFVVRKNQNQDEANCLVAEFEARGHKQMYWTECDRKASDHNLQ